MAYRGVGGYRRKSTVVRIECDDFVVLEIQGDDGLFASPVCLVVFPLFDSVIETAEFRFS